MTISANDAEILRAAGFLEYEIDAYANAATGDGNPQPPINITSPIWQAIITSRMDWTENLIQRGWTKEEIDNELMNYYRRDQKRTPFDFIRAEYKPYKKVDYMDIVKKRQQVEINKDVHGYYDRRLKKYR